MAVRGRIRNEAAAPHRPWLVVSPHLLDFLGVAAACCNAKYVFSLTDNISNTLISNARR
jgi:hypothetical protein